MVTPKTKFIVGQEVYVNTPDGLVFTKIYQVAILITAEDMRTQYRMEKSYDSYEEYQVMADKKEVKKKTDANLKQLGILFLEN